MNEFRTLLSKLLRDKQCKRRPKSAAVPVEK